MATKNINLKPYIIVAAVLILLAVAIFLYTHFKKPKVVPDDNVVTSDGKVQWTNDIFPLKLGSKGEKVKYLQAALNIAYNSRLGTDGQMGAKTVADLKKNTGFDFVSEQAYNDIVEPRIDLIKAYLKKIATAGTNPKPTTAAPANIPTSIGIDEGDSVQASRTTTGMKVLKNMLSGAYKISDDAYGTFKPNEYIGVVLEVQNQWLVCATANGHGVYVLKDAVKLIKL